MFELDDLTAELIILLKVVMILGSVRQADLYTHIHIRTLTHTHTQTHTHTHTHTHNDIISRVNESKKSK